MRLRALYLFLALAIFAGVIGLWRTKYASATAVPPINYRTSWNPQAAADYLDRREVWWQNWPGAKVDHGTICVSCHTVLPYAMTRSALGQELHEAAVPAPEKIMIANVEQRVAHWSEMVPFYSDAVDGPGKTAQSHATESVLNAVILTSCDAKSGHLRPITRTALDEAWELQEKSGEIAGGWKWEDFHLAPFESADSAYLGAALLMQVVENAPDGYASEAQIQENLQLLQQYLRSHYAAQPLMNQLYILWLSPKVPALVSAAERKTLLDAVERHQRADGGWSLSSLDPVSRMEGDKWRRLKQQFKEQVMETVKPAESDGYATALVVLVLEESGMSLQEGTLRRGLEWLERHQASDGSWRTSSLNIKIDPSTDLGRFMSDAATAYAVMALENQPRLLKGK